MTVSPTDWQCCEEVGNGLLCTKALIYGSHEGPHEHVHDYEMCGNETMCGCARANPVMSDEQKKIKVGDLILPGLGMSISEVAKQGEAGTLSGQAKEFFDETERGLESFTKEDRSFDCENCGVHVVPEASQWIFYNFCNDCFVKFDRQKMNGRSSGLLDFEDGRETRLKEGVDYFESSSAWMANNKRKASA